MFKLLFLWPPSSKRGSAEGQRRDVWAEVAPSASGEVERIYNNEKCIYPQLLFLLFSPPKKHRHERRVCVSETEWRLCHIQHARGKVKNAHFKKPQTCRVGTYLQRCGKSNCGHQEMRLMMIDVHRLRLTPTHDYSVFIYPPVAPSPSALFGLSEEACMRRTRCLCDFYWVILTKLTSLTRL